MIKKNKIVFKKCKLLDKLIAKYDKEKAISFSIKWNEAVKKVELQDLK